MSRALRHVGLSQPSVTFFTAAVLVIAAAFSAQARAEPGIYCNCPGDTNCDYLVNYEDLARIRRFFFEECSGCPEDLNSDGRTRSETWAC